MRASDRIKDSFVLARERLSYQKPLRDEGLIKISAAISNGHFAFAERELSEYLKLHPTDTDAISLMARTQLRLGNLEQASTLLQRCLNLSPDDNAIRFNYAEALYNLKDYAASLCEINNLLKSDDLNPLFRELKANVLEAIGDNEQSQEICRQLAVENPSRAETWVKYGHALRAAGKQEQSVAAYRRAIAITPCNGLAYWSLANMKAVALTEDDAATIDAILQRSDISPEDRIPLEYALGKAREDLGQYQKSFQHYSKANAVMRVRFKYNADALTKLVKANKALFTPEFFHAENESGYEARDPVFIVSPPRSGSTLIEQILSSHSAIEGTAELPYIGMLAKRLEANLGDGQSYLEALRNLDRAHLRSMGHDYIQKVRIHRKLGKPFFIDKNPPNFLHVGLIHLILPNAKIIDARRHPAACCFSIFKQYLKRARPNLFELGRFYHDYVELMAHFDSVLPNKVCRVIYEDVVQDPETEVRRLLNYLELPFEANCLRFYETKRSILTPSSEQVRKPITAAAVDHWKNYEPWLGPLFKGLGSVAHFYPAAPPEMHI